MSTDEQPQRGVEDLDWTDEDEAAADRAWAKLDARWRREEGTAPRPRGKQVRLKERPAKRTD